MPVIPTATKRGPGEGESLEKDEYGMNNVVVLLNRTAAAQQQVESWKHVTTPDAINPIDHGEHGTAGTPAMP